MLRGRWVGDHLGGHVVVGDQREHGAVLGQQDVFVRVGVDRVEGPLVRRQIRSILARGAQLVVGEQPENGGQVRAGCGAQPKRPAVDAEC